MNVEHALLKSDTDYILSLSLVVPCYIVFFIGNEPYIQGLAYICYPLSLILLFFVKKNIVVTRNFLFYWLLFVSAWIIPSIINSSDSTLESDLVRLDVLFVNVFYLSVIIFSILQWRYYSKDFGIRSLLQNIWLLLIPIVLIIVFKSIYLRILISGRPSPFGNEAGVASEIIFIFLMGSFCLRNRVLKWSGLFISIVGIGLLDTRSYLIPLITLFIILEIYPWLKSLKLTLKKFFFLFVSFVSLIIFFHQFLFGIADSIFSLSSPTRGFGSGLTGRMPIYEVAIYSIKNNPMLGIGYWVHPLGYSVPDFLDVRWVTDPSRDIHNAYLRIWTENGFFLTFMIIGTIIYSLYKLIKKKMTFEFCFALSIIFILFFSTRHLTLNLLNIILYSIILIGLVTEKSFFSKESK